MIMKMINGIALLLVIVGAVNWGLVGAFEFNLVSFLFGPGTLFSRIIYSLVGISGLIGADLLRKAWRLTETGKAFFPELNQV